MSALVFPGSVSFEAPSRDLSGLKAKLLRRARELMAQDAELRERLAAEQSATANTFVAGVEGARAAEADDEVIALLRHEQEEMRSIQAALQRMAEGRYGECLECGEPIGALRLSVLPAAALCVSCQGMAEYRAEHEALR